jgi:hypothetical protein
MGMAHSMNEGKKTLIQNFVKKIFKNHLGDLGIKQEQGAFETDLMRNVVGECGLL